MRPVFALTVSDAVTDDMLEERIEILAALAERFPSMGAVRIRDDAMDADLLREAAGRAYALGLEVVLESDIVENLAAAYVPGSLFSSPASDQGGLIRTAAGCGAGVVIADRDPERLAGFASVADALGCPKVVVDPDVRSMKECHESTVRIGRIDALGGLPLAVRAWSGEYALAVASVGVMDGASMVVLDDLDMQACAVLDGLIRSGIRSPAMRRARHRTRDDKERRNETTVPSFYQS